MLVLLSCRDEEGRAILTTQVKITKTPPRQFSFFCERDEAELIRQVQYLFVVALVLTYLMDQNLHDERELLCIAIVALFLLPATQRYGEWGKG